MITCSVSHGFVVGVLSSLVTTLQSLESIGLVELEIIAFVISVPIPISFPMMRFHCRGLQMAFLITFCDKKTSLNYVFFKNLKS